MPSPNLSTLRIYNYKGVHFPCWLGDEILGNVTRITLSNCKNCVELPPFGNLPKLQHLEISGMNFVQYVDNQCYDGWLKRCFVQLKSLWLTDLPNLERLSREEGKEMFPFLSHLHVYNCPKLMLPGLESVKILEVGGVNELLLKSISNLCCLTRLCLSNNDNVTSFPQGMLENLTTLKSLRIFTFTKLQEFSSDMLMGCKALETLDISCCDELKCLPEGIFQSSSCLQDITIDNCKNLKSLSDSFGDLTALQSLELIACPELVGFPTSLGRLSSLRNLTMSELVFERPELVHLPEAFHTSLHLNP